MNYQKKLLNFLLILLILIMPISINAEENGSQKPTEIFEDEYLIAGDKNNNGEYTEKRKYYRFANAVIKEPVIITGDDILELNDISRGGVGVIHDNKLKPGQKVKIKIRYKNINFTTDVKIVSSDKTRAGGEFCTEDKEVQNMLLYLSILLESDNGMLITRFRS